MPRTAKQTRAPQQPTIMGVREYSKLSDRAGDLEDAYLTAENQKDELETNVLFEPATNALIKKLRTTLNAEYKRLAKLYVAAEKALDIEDRKRAKVLPYCQQCGKLKQQCFHKN